MLAIGFGVLVCVVFIVVPILVLMTRNTKIKRDHLTVDPKPTEKN